MNNTKTLAGRVEKKMRRRFNKHSKAVRTTAVLLAFVMAFSALGANISSIVNLLEAHAADLYTESDSYTAQLTLYDYYTDGEYKTASGTKMEDNNGQSYGMKLFNEALFNSGYSLMAEDAAAGRTWDNKNLYYFPLYQGLQHNNNGYSQEYKDMVDDPRYNYSLTVNSQADTSSNAAAQGLVDKELLNGVITQGGGRVALPYFDEEFLNRPIKNFVTANEADLTKIGNKPIGKVQSELNFKFVKQTGTNNYIFDSAKDANMGLSYSNKTFSAGDFDNSTYKQKYDKDWGGSKPGFFPWNYIEDRGNSDFAYGARFDIPFTMSEDGQVYKYGSSSVKEDIKFEFRGDDDVWVFVDGYLVLDLGGAHGAVDGSINFGKDHPSTYVSSTKTSDFYNRFDDATSGGSVTVNGGDTVTSDGKTLSQLFTDVLGLYSDVTKKHTLTVFYLERGALESNCKITFNFLVSDSLSVVNNLDLENVNEWFLEETEKVAAKEAVAYTIKSNSESATSSPDAGPINDSDDFTKGDTIEHYSLKFYNSNGESVAVSGYDNLAEGTRVKLPEGYAITVKENYYVAGWHREDYPNECRTTYTVAGADAHSKEIKFYPVIRKFPLILDMPNAPSLVEVRGSGVKVVEINNVGANNSDKTFCNATKNPPDHMWFKIVLNNNPEQIPGDKDQLRYNGCDGNTFKMESGYVYLLDHKWDDSQNKIVKTDVSNFTNSTSYTSYDEWIAKYYQVYQALIAARSRLDNYYMNNDPNFTAMKDVYETQLEKYYEAVPSSKSDTGSSLDNILNDLTTGIPDVSYTYTYAYGDDTVTFYVYSPGGKPTVTITNIDGKGLNSADGVSISGPSAAPVTAQSGYTGSYYYTVTVKKSIIATGKAEGYSDVTETIPTEIRIVAGSNTETTDSSTIASALPSKPHYCYFTGDGWRDITDSPVTYKYSDYKIVWFFDTQSRTVTYSGDNMASGSVTTTKDVWRYYWAEVPTKVTGTDGSSSAVKLNFNSVTVNAPSDNAQCYFTKQTSIKNGATVTHISDGWYKLVTIFAPYDNCADVYAWNSYGDTYPCKYEWSDGGSGAVGMERAANSGSTKYYYTYLPYNDNIGLKLMYSGNRPDYTLTKYDRLFSNDDQSANPWNPSVTEGAPGYDSNYKFLYQYTATAKATSLLTHTYSLSDDIPISGGAADTMREPPRSGGNDGKGQFKNDSTGYVDANGVNFKLYNSNDPNDPDAESVLRRTGDSVNGSDADKYNNKFYMHFGQSAKFTFQFKRGSGLKLAQTGDSSFYEKRNAVIPSKAGGTDKAVSTDKSKSLYNRYSTTWRLIDSAGAQMVSTRQDYNVYNYSESSVKFLDANGNSTSASSSFNNSSYYNAGAFYVNDIQQNASDKSDLQLTAEFTNSVLTGDLYIKKVLSDDALKEIDEFNAKYPGAAGKSYKDNLKFTFNVKFSNIFGGGSAESNYSGGYYIVDSDENYYTMDFKSKYKRVTKDDGSYECDDDGNILYKKVNSDGTPDGNPVTADIAGVQFNTTDGNITLRYADASQDPKNEDVTGVGKRNTSVVKDSSGNVTGTVKMIKIEGVPVETFYEVTETKISAGTTYDDKSDKPDLKQDHADYFENISPDELYWDPTTKKQITSVLENTAVGKADGAIAVYYGFKSADSKVEIINTPSAYYIVLRKTIDKLYYHTQEGDGNTDNPAGLYNSSAKVGGATGNDPNDANGYQEATQAEQSFVFTIVEYDSGGRGVNRFTEAISFGSDDTDRTKAIVIKANTGHRYVITEQNGWSWKYSFVSSQLNQEGTTDSVEVTVPSGTSKYTEEYGDKDHCAIVAYTNNHATDSKKDVEGDTSIAVNKAEVKKAS